MVDGIKEDIDKKPERSQNKAIKFISNLLFIVFMMIMAFLIFITAQSRFTGQEPSLLGHRLYIVESGSMLPALKINSMLIAKELPSNEIKIGDILTFSGKNADVKITHRVVKIENNGESFITRGDANNTDDPNPVTKDRVIGKVIFSIPFIGLIFKILENPIAIGILVILGVAWIFIPHILKKKEKTLY